jgi:hypothetical protein
MFSGAPRKLPTRFGYDAWFIATGLDSYALLNKADDAAPYLGWLDEGNVYFGDQQSRVSATVHGNLLVDGQGNTIATADSKNVVSNSNGQVIAHGQGASCTPAMVLMGALVLYIK